MVGKRWGGKRGGWLVAHIHTRKELGKLETAVAVETVGIVTHSSHCVVQWVGNPYYSELLGHVSPRNKQFFCFYSV